MNGSRHLDAQRVYDLLDGRLDALAEGAAQAHLLRCERCRRLERECAGVIDSLRWYGSEPVEPPAGYGDTFWERWTAPDPEIRSVPRTDALPPAAARRAGWRLAPVLAMAAALALLVGLWWSGRTEPPGSGEFAAAPPARAPELREAMASVGWADDYARFERMSIAVGGIDPVSKGIVLASMAQEP
jgi:hypothetical protein